MCYLLGVIVLSLGVAFIHSAGCVFDCAAVCLFVRLSGLVVRLSVGLCELSVYWASYSFVEVNLGGLAG